MTFFLSFYNAAELQPDLRYVLFFHKIVNESLEQDGEAFAPATVVRGRSWSRVVIVV
jgi:hypothetical protein